MNNRRIGRCVDWVAENPVDGGTGLIPDSVEDYRFRNLGERRRGIERVCDPNTVVNRTHGLCRGGRWINAPRIIAKYILCGKYDIERKGACTRCGCRRAVNELVKVLLKLGLHGCR
jgi:hypothetical protein